MTGSPMCACTSVVFKVKHCGPKNSLITNFSEKVLKSGVDILLHRLSKGALTSVHNKQERKTQNWTLWLSLLLCSTQHRHTFGRINLVLCVTHLSTGWKRVCVHMSIEFTLQTKAAQTVCDVMIKHGRPTGAPCVPMQKNVLVVGSLCQGVSQLCVIWEQSTEFCSAGLINPFK